MYRLEFITSLPPPLQKKRTKTEAKCSVWLSVWLEAATGTSFCGPCETQMNTGPWQPHTIPMLSKAELEFMNHTQSYAWNPTWKHHGEQEPFLREIPALPHVTAIARKRLSLPIYQKQLLNISAFASIFNKKITSIWDSPKGCVLWCLTGGRDAKKILCHFHRSCDVLNTCTIIYNWVMEGFSERAVCSFWFPGNKHTGNAQWRLKSYWIIAVYPVYRL